MTKVTIIGATGSLGRIVTKTLLAETDVNLLLFSRRAALLADDRKVEKVSASVFDAVELKKAVSDADLVFVALSGDLPSMAKAIIDAMKATGSKRLIFITSYGIYGELPGQNGQVQPILAPYRKAADLIEASGLDYTILRPGWFDNSPDLSYALIPKGEVIYGNNISRSAIARFVKEVVENPHDYIQNNWGMVR